MQFLLKKSYKEIYYVACARLRAALFGKRKGAANREAEQDGRVMINYIHRNSRMKSISLYNTVCK